MLDPPSTLLRDPALGVYRQAKIDEPEGSIGRDVGIVGIAGID